MRILRRRTVAATALGGLVLLGLSGSSWAKTATTRARAAVHAIHKPSLRSAKRGTKNPVAAMHGEEVVPGVMPVETALAGSVPENTGLNLTDQAVPSQAMPNQVGVNPDVPSQIASAKAGDSAMTAAITPQVDGKPYVLRMSNLHTGETLNIVYRIGNTYIPEALEKLNYFLRDHNTQDVVPYSPKEFDVLHAMMSRLGKVNGLINIVCGYRTPETNEALRHDAPWTGVAEHSQHMEGHAIDLRVPGVSTAQLRNAALSLHAGGVGYYPVSQFVHIDVGPVREWVHGRQAPAKRRKRHVRSAAAM